MLFYPNNHRSNPLKPQNLKKKKKLKEILIMWKLYLKLSFLAEEFINLSLQNNKEEFIDLSLCNNYKSDIEKKLG